MNPYDRCDTPADTRRQILSDLHDLSVHAESDLTALSTASRRGDLDGARVALDRLRKITDQMANYAGLPV